MNIISKIRKRVRLNRWRSKFLPNELFEHIQRESQRVEKWPKWKRDEVQRRIDEHNSRLEEQGE